MLPVRLGHNFDCLDGRQLLHCSSLTEKNFVQENAYNNENNLMNTPVREFRMKGKCKSKDMGSSSTRRWFHFDKCCVSLF